MLLFMWDLERLSLDESATFSVPLLSLLMIKHFHGVSIRLHAAFTRDASLTIEDIAPGEIRHTYLDAHTALIYFGVFGSTL